MEMVTIRCIGYTRSHVDRQPGRRSLIPTRVDWENRVSLGSAQVHLRSNAVWRRNPHRKVLHKMWGTERRKPNPNNGLIRGILSLNPCTDLKYGNDHADECTFCMFHRSPVPIIRKYATPGFTSTLTHRPGYFLVYPALQSDMAHIDPGDLLPNEHIQQLVADDEITQMHRGHAYAEEGDTFDIDGQTFEVVGVTERTLGDLTDEDARREGSADLAAYRERLNRAHENFEWNDDSDVVRHRFEPVSE